MIIELKRHTLKTPTGQVSKEGVQIVKQRISEEIENIASDGRSTMCYHTSKTRTSDTLDLIQQSQVSYGQANWKYCGEAEELNEGSVEDYIPQLKKYITERINVKEEVANKFVDHLWFEFWMEADEYFFDEFDCDIKSGKQAAREALGWIIQKLDCVSDYDHLAITHGTIIGAVVYTIQKKLELSNTLLSDDSSINFSIGGKIEPLTRLVIHKGSENSDIVQMTFNSVTIPLSMNTLRGVIM